MYTFLDLKTEVRNDVFAVGEAENLVTPHNNFIRDCLVELQQWVVCLQQDNTDIVPACATLYNCGLTVLDAPRGIIKSVSVIDKLDADGNESATADDDWCSRIYYPEIEYCHISRYLDYASSCGVCYNPNLYFGLSCTRSYPAPTDEGIDPTLPAPPLGMHYSQESTNRDWGRNGEGVWAKERGHIYIAPWLQTTESVIVTWDGIKRVWSDGDPVDDDPMLIRAVRAYVTWKHAEKYDHEFADAVAARSEYEETRALLIHQCREETRARECEPSHARSAPDRITQLFYNDQQSFTASCPAGQEGDDVTVTIAAGTVSSTISKADANQRALTQATQQANAQLDCSSASATYYNLNEHRVTLYCSGDDEHPTPDGVPVTGVVAVAEISGTTQAEAEQNAEIEAHNRAVTARNASPCTYWNKEQSYTAVCETDASVSATETVAAHAVSSTVSADDADGEALRQARNAAIASLAIVCGDTTFWNTQQTIGPRSYVTPGSPGHPICVVTLTVVIAADQFSSNVSQSAANTAATNFAEQYLQMQLINYANAGNCTTATLNIP